MAPKFGTSGLRGLVVELTDPVCAGYTRAFLSATGAHGAVLIGRDLRASSPRIARAVAAGARAAGCDPIDCGVVPTPSLALAAARRGASAVMVTGSHIPDDRNGLKFYTALGEITKEDEARIGAAFCPCDESPVAPPRQSVHDAFVARYTDYFGPKALSGCRIGIYEHSSAAREAMTAILTGLGAVAVRLGRSDEFVPVDTEAVSRETRAMLHDWAKSDQFDAIVSTDGDGDRPLVADAQGAVIPGDRLGPLTAQALNADTVVTPVSSNSLVDQMSEFRVIRTRIGSPYVIEAMVGARPARVVGYEANGGFLLGFSADGPTGTLTDLMTRDSILPIVAPLAMARDRGMSLAMLNDALPSRFTASDRLQNVDPATSAALVQDLISASDLQVAIFGETVPSESFDLTDGVRATRRDGTIIHLRPSGNAPEFRVYSEAKNRETAKNILFQSLQRISSLLTLRS